MISYIRTIGDFLIKFKIVGINGPSLSLSLCVCVVWIVTLKSLNYSESYIIIGECKWTETKRTSAVRTSSECNQSDPVLFQLIPSI